MFASLVLYLKFDHIFERDESQILLIVNHNRNFFSLIKTFGYEGTTGLWHILLWLFSYVIPITPQTVSIIHYIIILVFIWVLIFKIDIPLIFKILFLLQANVLWNFIYVRQYIFALLFINLIVNSILNNRKLLSYLWVVLLMQVHVTTVPIAISFLFFMLAIEFTKKRQIEFKQIIIPALGLVFAVLQVLPPSDLAAGLGEWHMPTSVYGIIGQFNDITKDMFLVNDNLLQILSIPILLTAIIINAFKKNKVLVIISILSFLISLLAFVIIRTTKYLCPHHTYLLLYTLLALTILVWKQTNLRINKYSYIILIPILLYSAYIYKVRITDYKYAPFSYADKVADYLDKNHKDETVLIFPETLYNSVRVYREQNSPVYSLGRNEYSNYTIWNHPSVDHVLYTLLPVQTSDLENYLISVPDSIIYKKPILIIGSEINQYFVDPIGNEIKSDYKLNDEFTLEYIKFFDGKSIKYITEKFILFRVIKTI